MRLGFTLMIAGAFAAIAAKALDVASGASISPASEATAYFAPVNRAVFKVVWPGGGIRELEYDYSRPGMLRGEENWSGRAVAEAKIQIDSGDGKAKYVFDRGRLISSSTENGNREYPYELTRPPPDRSFSSHLVDKADMAKAAKIYSYNELLHKWEGTKRLQFPFINPNQNGVLFAEILFLCLALMLHFRSFSVRVGAGAIGACSLVCLVWTMSRGAWLGAILAFVPFAALRFRSFFRAKWTWLGGGILALAFAAWAILFGFDQIIRGFESGGWTNAIRVEIWRNVPRMMFDAPGGWGFFGVGPAYLQWYQPLDVLALTPTLINDHFTWMVGWGWCGRFAYLLALFSVFAVSIVAVAHDRKPLPLAMWTLFATAAWFNPIFNKVALWILPVLCSAPLTRSFPWHRTRAVVVTFIITAALAAVSCVGLYFKGEADSLRNGRIRADGRKVLVHGMRPSVWIVDDGSLGGGLTGKDIREFYSVEHAAPAIGYVSEVADLPKSVDRLVLSGHAGADWLTMLSENPAARQNLPKSVIFVSPPFPPSAVPEGVQKMCKVKILIGEFAALHDPGYVRPPAWVEIVPGMESYVLRWMWTIMEP